MRLQRGNNHDRDSANAAFALAFDSCVMASFALAFDSSAFSFAFDSNAFDLNQMHLI